VSADRVQLQQVLMNLMLNGIEAMRATGGELTIASQYQNCEVLITIADLGVGLPTQNVDQIFAAFFTTKPQGSGMGLAISRSIIEAHGGRLWATANAGRGATFLFTLPHASPQGGFEIAAEPGAVTPSSLSNAAVMISLDAIAGYCHGRLSFRTRKTKPIKRNSNEYCPNPSGTRIDHRSG
jgi:hypothetical protein